MINSLPGHCGYGPVRIGNVAVIQRQNEPLARWCYGGAEVLGRTSARTSDLELYRQLSVVGNEAHRAALTPDAGLWEYRERQEVHTFSAAMCWAAQNRLSLIVKRIGVDAEAREWLARAGLPRQGVLQGKPSIDALASVGRRQKALELFNHPPARRNQVRLWSEDIDPSTGELWGNFPRTYSQVGLILSAMRLSRSWEEGPWHAS